MFTGKCCGHSYNIFEFNRKYHSGVFIYEQVEHILLAVQFSTRSEHGLWSMKPTSITLIIVVLNDYQYLIMIEATSFFFFLLSEIACLFLKLLSLLPSMWISIQFDKFHVDFCWYSDWKCKNLKISMERNDILFFFFFF